MGGRGEREGRVKGGRGVRLRGRSLCIKHLSIFYRLDKTTSDCRWLDKTTSDCRLSVSLSLSPYLLILEVSNGEALVDVDGWLPQPGADRLFGDLPGRQ